MPDLVTFGETMLRLSCPPGERLGSTPRFEVHVGGSESNVAVAASQLDTEAVWLSKLPDSALGRRVATALRSRGVRTGVAWVDPDDHRLGSYYLERGSAPRGSKVEYDRAGSAVTTTTPDELPTDVVGEADALFVSGITPALSDQLAETTRSLIETAKNAGTTTVFDPNYRKKLWRPAVAKEAYEELLPAVDVLVVSQSDAVEVLGMTDRPVKIANGLLSTYDCRTVVVTRGDRGALGLHGGEVHEQEAFETETVDGVGSGDAFVGGFLAARLAGDDLQRALAVGAATGALARTTVGDMLDTTPDEVDRVITHGATDEMAR